MLLVGPGPVASGQGGVSGRTRQVSLASQFMADMSSRSALFAPFYSCIVFRSPVPLFFLLFGHNAVPLSTSEAWFRYNRCIDSSLLPSHLSCEGIKGTHQGNPPSAQLHPASADPLAWLIFHSSIWLHLRPFQVIASTAMSAQ